MHEFIQELNEVEDKHWDSVTINETWRTQKEGLWKTQEGRTYMGLDGKQLSMPRTRSSHPQVVKPIHQRRTTLQTKTQGRDHRDKEVQIAQRLSLQPTQSVRRRTRATIFLNCKKQPHLETTHLTCWETSTSK